MVLRPIEGTSAVNGDYASFVAGLSDGLVNEEQVRKQKLSFLCFAKKREGGLNKFLQ